MMCRISFSQGCTWQEERQTTSLEPEDQDGHQGVAVSIKVRKLLHWSMMSICEEQLAFLGLPAWLGAVVDNSLPVGDATDNSLDAPELVGPKGRSCKNHCISWEKFQEPHALLLNGKKALKKDKNANQ